MTQTRSGVSLVGKISSYLQIVSKDPHSTAFVPLAEAYRQIGLLDDALEAARMGTNMLPHFSPGFATLGRILGQMGHIDEAMSAFARALSIDRQSQSALVGLARLHLVRGEREQARKILTQAAEFHPDDVMVENMLIALDLPRPWCGGQTVAAVEPASAQPFVAEETSVEPAGGEPIPTATLAEIYARQGLTDQAARVYEEILRAEPDNQAAIRRLGELRGGSGMGPAPVELAQDETPPQAESPQSQVRRQPLEVFEGWLQAIHVRRAHVQ
jgi:tetratricopeptide (TPR) repeat protein